MFYVYSSHLNIYTYLHFLQHKKTFCSFLELITVFSASDVPFIFYTSTSFALNIHEADTFWKAMDKAVPLFNVKLGQERKFYRLYFDTGFFALSSRLCVRRGGIPRKRNRDAVHLFFKSLDRRWVKAVCTERSRSTAESSQCLCRASLDDSFPFPQAQPNRARRCFSIRPPADGSIGTGNSTDAVTGSSEVDHRERNHRHIYDERTSKRSGISCSKGAPSFRRQGVAKENRLARVFRGRVT